MLPSPVVEGLYIALISVHGLVRGEGLELGRNADTGGQVKYVVEMARALAEQPGVWRVDLITRLIEDPRYSPDYARPEEPLSERARIVRIRFGPERYVRKEALWRHLPSFVDGALRHFRSTGRTPDLIHAHYADAGYVGADLASLLAVPLVFTGHSLGREKLRRLLDGGAGRDSIEAQYHIGERIEAEERALSHAALVVASTQQEASRQYAAYVNYRKTRTVVIPPGVDLHRFSPPKRGEPKPPIYDRIARFLQRPDKPWILALSRPDERKNIHSLVDAYGTCAELRQKANLILIAGARDEFMAMDQGPRRVVRDMLNRIDRYDLYGSVAYPKHHDADEVPALYRLAAESGGVFINPALTEPFGLTLIESAASGLPVVATDDGGPREILSHCRNGLLIDPLAAPEMAQTLLGALHDRRRWRRWARHGVRSAARYYSWQGHAETYLRAVRRILDYPHGRKRRVPKTRLPSVDRILVTDIDDTLLGDNGGLAALLKRIERAGSKTAFGVATGRRLESALDVLDQYGVPLPDLLITSVGSEIHYGRRLVEDEEWRRNIDYRWSTQGIRELLEDMPGLKLQPKVDQRAHKVSYFMDPARAPGIEEIAAALREIGVQANLIFSHGQYLDLLPIRSSKGLALRYVAHRWGIPMESVLVAGDSGNDLDMLSGRALGVVVSNHGAELEKLKGEPRVYFAGAPHSWGILEGIDHYDFFGEIRQPAEP